MHYMAGECAHTRADRRSRQDERMVLNEEQLLITQSSNIPTTAIASKDRKTFKNKGTSRTTKETG